MRSVHPIIYFLAIVVLLALVVSLLFVRYSPYRISTLLIASIPPRLPLPQVTRGEFPFRVEYTIEGETFIVEDVYIAEFAGIGFNAGVGRHRLWNGYIQSSGLAWVHVLAVDETRTIYISVGGAAYYLSDRNIISSDPFIPGFIMVERRDSGTRGISWQDAEFRPYNVELIHWELSPPIVNTFR